MADLVLNLDLVRKQIAEARKQLQQKEAQRADLEKSIEDLRELIRANANFLPDEEKVMELMMVGILRTPTNITQAVHLALMFGMVSNNRMTPTAIRDVAEIRGFDFSNYTNPLASIHSILKRMKDSGAVDYEEKDGTYLMLQVPETVIDPGFEAKFTRKLWERLAADKQLKTMAQDVMKHEALVLMKQPPE